MESVNKDVIKAFELYKAAADFGILRQCIILEICTTLEQELLKILRWHTELFFFQNEWHNRK